MASAPEGTGSVAVTTAVEPTADELAAVLNQLPEADRQTVISVIESRTLSHSGPLPSPPQLQGYENVLPGLAERIVRLTEREQEERHRIVERALRRDARLKERGQIMAMAALILLLGLCVLLVLQGSPYTAGVVASVAVVGVVSIFVTGKRADAKAATASDDVE